MFVQVIQGKVADAGRVRAQLDRWVSEVAPGSVGWLGSTGGVTDAGDLVLLARFDSEDAAAQNGDRAEQGAWWEETSQLFEDEPRFNNSVFVEVDTPGDPGRAGFVQVMQGRVSDLDRARELMGDDSVDMSATRPDILGSVLAGHEGGRWTMAIYFTSEAEAREGEQQEPSAEVAETMKRFEELNLEPVTYFDLTDPWLHAPG